MDNHGRAVISRRVVDPGLDVTPILLRRPRGAGPQRGEPGGGVAEETWASARGIWATQGNGSVW
jgi:hypothetical protein